MEKLQKILITGGAGYIGTNILSVLLPQNYNIVVVDNLSNSYPEHINLLCKKYPHNLRFLQLDLLDDNALKRLFDEEKFDAVIHLASKKYVQESFLFPDEYYEQNVKITQKILDYMQFYGVKRLIFPSSITVYGNCTHFPVAENQEQNPVSPYSKNKKECEELIKLWQKESGFGATILRLSNPIGANGLLSLGDDPKNKKYMGVLPYIISKVKNDEELKFNGNNHNTKDGTTVRDYIHVLDVANAFGLALKNCQVGKFEIFNIGYGKDGFSVLEILTEVESELKVKAHYTFGPKKDGDMSIFISDTQKAKLKLGFDTKYNLNDMVKSQIEFDSKNN